MSDHKPMSMSYRFYEGFSQSQKWLTVASVLLLFLITLAHYSTNTHDEILHHTYRRLYYLPVVLAAFAFGWRGGSLMATCASLAYMPHAFFMHHHQDPAPTNDKIFEMILYVLVGLLTGWLVDREQASQKALRKALYDRTQMEEALIRAGKLSALGHLLAGVAHELRNPLASIMGAAEGLERGLQQQTINYERAQKLLSLQQRELKRLETSVSHFLAFAKLRTPQINELNLGELVKEIIELAQHQEQKGQFVVSSELKTQKLWADKDHLQQVLLNLTLNEMHASKADEPFEITYLFKETIHLDQAYLCIGVSDKGVGITDEQKERIYEPFYSTKHAGTGLGLSISSRIVEAHQGYIELSQEHAQTCFWVCMPKLESSDGVMK